MAAAERRIDALARRCYVGLDAASLRDETLRGLRAIVPIDAAFFAVVDPATMLFTAILAEEPLGEAGALFLENEFGQADVNKFTALVWRVGSDFTVGLRDNGVCRLLRLLFCVLVMSRN